MTGGIMRIDRRAATFLAVGLIVGALVGALGFREAQQIFLLPVPSPSPCSPMTCGDKSLPLQDNAWQLRVNTTYQDAMKTFMPLVTASLVIPLFVVRNFLRVKENEPISKDLTWPAYCSWILMLLSLGCCMTFFWSSAKYVNDASGATEKWFGVNVCPAPFETLGDASVWGSVGFFIVALLFGWYFAKDIRKRE